MIMQPKYVTKDLYQQAIEQVTKKKKDLPPCQNCALKPSTKLIRTDNAHRSILN
jgi:hypothetical protein